MKKKYERNPLNGQWLKGHASPTKGKKQSEFMTPEGIKKALANLTNRGNNPFFAGWNKRKVLGIKDGVVVYVFDSQVEAAQALGVHINSVNRWVKGKRKAANGVPWYVPMENDYLLKKLK